MAIMSRPLSERGRDEHDRIFNDKRKCIQTADGAVKTMDCVKRDCPSRNFCNGKWCIDGYQ